VLCKFSSSLEIPLIQYQTWRFKMKAIRQFAASTVAVVVLVGLSGCSGMSRQDRNTAIGAGVGGVAGSVLTDGGALGTVGGAAVGGVIGNQVK
jgi:osmotically inducible lipoprotein OsmB